MKHRNHAEEIAAAMAEDAERMDAAPIWTPHVMDEMAGAVQIVGWSVVGGIATVLVAVALWGWL